MDKVNAMGVHEVGKARGATDSCDNADFLVRNSELLHDIEKGSENGEVTTSGTPSWVVGFELLFSELFRGSGGGQVRHDRKMVKGYLAAMSFSAAVTISRTRKPMP